MTPFRFRLEPVLEQREREEDLAQRELARAISAAAAQQELAVAADRAAEAALADLRALQTGGPVPLRELRERHDALARARMIAAHEAAAARALEAVAAERRRDLVAARQAVEALERLKERQRSAHLAELRRHDARHLDEVALRRYRAGARLGGAPA